MSRTEALRRSTDNMMNLDEPEEPGVFDSFIQNMSTEAIQRSIENMMEPSDIDDEGGSFHFGAPASVQEEEPKKVRFNSQVRCLKPSKKASMDFEGYWYSKAEITSFRKREKFIQTQMATRTRVPTGDDDGDDDSDHEASLIGLNSEKERRQRLQRIREGRECVTEEQLSQEEKFFSSNYDLESFQLDHEAISDCYYYYSRISSKIAHKRGLLVSSHVESLWEKEEEEDKKSTTATATTVIEATTSNNQSCSSQSPISGNRRRSRNFVLESAGGSIIARLAPAAA